MPDIEVVGTLGSRADLMAQRSELDAHVVLMDFRLPDGSGPETAAALRAERPETAVVFLSVDGNEESVLAAVEAGASGYFLKENLAAAELVSVVRRADQPDETLGSGADGPGGFDPGDSDSQ